MPTRKPSPPQPVTQDADRAELAAVWDALDDERRKAITFISRAMAKDAGLPGSEAPLIGRGSEGRGR